MIKFFYAVHDVHTGYLDPFLEVSDEAAIRGFCFSMDNQPGIVGFSPCDFHLYKVGMFDISSGEVIPVEPKLIYNAEDFFSEVNSDA